MRRWIDLGNSRDEYQVLTDIRELLLVIATATTEEPTAARNHLVNHLRQRREEVEDATD